MTISKDSARLSKTNWIGRVAGTVALAVAFAIAASPAAALAKKKKAADDGAAGTGIVDSAEAPAAACGATFSVCCTIGAAGMYSMSGNISTAITSGSCVSVSTSGVTINMSGFTINDTASSPGTSVGISMTGGNNDFLEGAGGTVTHFGTDVSVNPGTSSTDNAYIDNINVGNSTGTGILVEGRNVSVSSIFAGSNKNGVEIESCQNCSLNFGDIEDNSGYGVWINDSTQTVVGGTFTESNTGAGIYVGCNATPGSTSCTGDHGSDTKVFNGLTDSNGYGIYIEEGEDSNSVAFTDGSSNTTDDAFARNDSTCAETNWFENVFTNVSPSCINP